jgi:sulfite oxidase
MNRRHAAAVAGVIGAGAAVPVFCREQKPVAIKDSTSSFKLDDLQKFTPDSRPELPTFSFAEVQDHASSESCWVTFRGAVYDVTDFVAGHPGESSRLLMAGGSDLETYWNVYRLHYRGHILSFLEKYRIGNLISSDLEAARTAANFGDAFEDDPPRHRDCQPCTMKPFCGETRLDLLTESYYTPNEIFYKRNHHSVPRIDPEDYELVVEDCPELGIKGRTFTLKELKTLFPKAETVSVMQCAGNRGEDYHGLEGKGMFNSPHWNVAAISNAKYGGARMRDVLRYCGMDVDAYALGSKSAVGTKNPLGEQYAQQDWHAHFEAYDHCEPGENFCGSTFMDKVVDPFGDALVCYEMNGRELPRDHGYPVRAVIPGHAGARQPKFLHRIEMKPYAHPTLQCRGTPPNLDFENDLAHWPPKKDPTLRTIQTVQEMPVQSIVCWPPQNATMGRLKNDEIEIRGVAWSGGGSGIYRVDVTIDGGKTWEAADQLHKPVVQHRRSQYGWTQFFHKYKLTDEMKAKLARGEKLGLEVTSKAVDAQFNVQPDDPRPHWNSRGVAVNHWYRVKANVDPKYPAGMTHNPQLVKSSTGEFANTPTTGSFFVPWNEAGWKVAPQSVGEGHKNWYKLSTKQNVKNEPGIQAEVDWEYYRKLECKPYWEQPR